MSAAVYPHGKTDFNEILYLCVFFKSVEKIQLSLKYDKNNATSHEDQCIFFHIIRSFLLRMRNVADKIVEKIKKTFHVQYFFFSKIVPS